MSDQGYLGVNLTIPHKEIAYNSLEHLDDSAKLFGAVNTIAFKDKKLIGYSTDGYGFIKALEANFGCGLDGDNVFVLGCGGAGRTVALQSACSGAKKLWLADIDIDRIEKLKKELHIINSNLEVNYSTSLDNQMLGCKECSLIIQASPNGMLSLIHI